MRNLQHMLGGLGVGIGYNYGKIADYMVLDLPYYLLLDGRIDKQIAYAVHLG